MSWPYEEGRALQADSYLQDLSARPQDLSAASAASASGHTKSTGGKTTHFLVCARLILHELNIPLNTFKGGGRNQVQHSGHPQL